MEAAYEAEDAQGAGDEDDAEGAPLARGDGPTLVDLPAFPSLDSFPEPVCVSGADGRDGVSDVRESGAPPAATVSEATKNSQLSAVQLKRRKEQSKKLKTKQRVARAVSGRGGNGARPRSRAKIRKTAPLVIMKSSVDVADLPASADGGFIGRPFRPDNGPEVWNEDRLIQAGFKEILWDHQ